MDQDKRNYPAKRKKAKRTRQSYRAKTPDGRQNQLDALKKGIGKRKKFTPPPEAQPEPIKPEEPKWDTLKKQKLFKSDMYKMNVIQFAEEALGVQLYPVQEVILRSQYGLPLNLEQRETLRELTGSDEYSQKEKAEGVFILGARSGKSFLASIIALYESIVNGDKWRRNLNPGETGYVIIVATRLSQAQVVIGRSCARMLENSRIPHLMAESWATELALTNGITIISMPCNGTAGRGLPICCLILDELGWYKLEGARADEEVYSALRPRMAQFRGAKFLAISTPASKQGLLYQLYEEGQVPNRLTVKAPTHLVNPTIDPAFLESEKRRNLDNYEREFLATFSEQVDSFFPADKLRECFTLPGDVDPHRQHRYYCGIDQSGLSGTDRFAMSIAHRDGDQITVDVSRTWQTTDGESIVGEIKEIVGLYGIHAVVVDRYASGWVRNAFEKAGLEVTTRELLPTIYVNLKSLVIANRVSLPDTNGLRQGLLRTRAYYGKSQTLAIGHERTSDGHGDEADSVATAVYAASSNQSGGYFSDVLN